MFLISAARLFPSLPGSTIQPLQRVMNAAARVIMNLSLRNHVKPALNQLHWLPFEQRIIYKLCLFMHYIHIWQAPKYLSDCVFTVSAASGRYRLRSTGSPAYVLPRTRTKFGERGFRSSRLEHSSVRPSWHYWYGYIPETTQECTFWSCLQLTIAGAPGRVV